MGASADPKLLKAAAEAHHKAIGSISGPNGVTSRADWDAVNAALGRVVASVPKAQVMDVYNAVKDITDPKVPAYMKSLVNGPDAEKAYAAFLEFKDVVAKNQVTAASAPATVPSGDKIGAAAKALSDASYPFIKDVDWLSDVYLKPLPGKTAPDTLKAIDQMIVTQLDLSNSSQLFSVVRKSSSLSACATNRGDGKQDGRKPLEGSRGGTP